MSEPLRILVTLDEHYLSKLNIMLLSLLDSSPGETFEVYLMHASIPDEALITTRRLLGERGTLIPVPVRAEEFSDAPTSDRYPKEMYYRIFAAHYLPEQLERVLYLDPDIIVNQSLRELYDMPMGDNFFAAATHIRSLLHRFNEVRLDMDEDSPYINSGVMLINLKALRAEQKVQEVYDYIESHKTKLFLPDQDIISGLYGSRILPLDPLRYNMTERLFLQYRLQNRELTADYIRRHTAILHFCGRNKPWNSVYFGRLNEFYDRAAEKYDAFLKTL